jgi:hypothetical protein
MTPEFNDWWQGDYDDTDNEYRVDSPAYWAYAGWQAREAEITRLKELAEYRLKLLTKMPIDTFAPEDSTHINTLEKNT